VLRILVLKIGNRMFGLIVDSIIGGEETLVKPLPLFIKDCNCYSGVTILGDGKTAMILDPEGIIRLADLKFKEDNELDPAWGETKDNELAEYQNLLLFKGSGNETLAVDLAVVARIEVIGAAEIEQIGAKEFIKFNGNSLRVIRLEDYLPVNRGNHQPDKYYVIIPKLVSHPIGILIEKIFDNINTRIELNTENIVTEGLIGSAIYDNRLVLILNIYEIFEQADPQHYQLKDLRIAETRRVLLVEDTQFFQRAVSKHLGAAGYEVTLASNGREALELLTNQQFDVVLSDINMPVMDGLELAKKIRDQDKYCDLPLIALTSLTEEQLRRDDVTGCFDYHEWKLDRDSLLKTLETAIREGRRAKHAS
jgi:two-component system chemotaxis sensor kinase CheA